METLGSLLDKFTIARIREVKINDNAHCDEDDLIFASNQVRSLSEEIDSFIAAALQGKIQLEEPKYKYYETYKATTTDGIKTESFGCLISLLLDANLKIWELEDTRREKGLPPDYLEEINQTSNTFNEFRSIIVTEIDSRFANLIYEQLNSKKTTQVPKRCTCTS